MKPSLVLGTLALALTACGSSSAQPDAAPSDAGARDVVSADASGSDDTGDMSMDDTGDETTDMARDFTLSARGFGGSMGKAMGVWVMDTDQRQVLGYGLLAAVDQADVDFRMPSLVPEGDYTAEVWIDGNGNGSYDGPTTDPSWRVSIPQTGSATVIVNATDATTDISMPARRVYTNFTMQLSGLTADEAGKRMELRVIDPGSGATVGGYALPALPTAATYSLALPGIVQSGSAYNVDFWIDMNGDGVYSGSGVDRTWRVMVTPGDSGAMVAWTQDTSYVELNWR